MADLGSVLRGWGSVLNPQVMQSNDADIRARQAQEQKMQDMMLGQVIKGVESGAIDPSKLAGTPLAGVVGVSPEAQARQQALAQEKGFREALAQLGPNASEDDIAKTAVRFGKPEIAAQYAKTKEDRAMRVQQAANNLAIQQRQIDQAHEFKMAQAKSTEERNAEIARHNKVREALEGQMAASNAALKSLGLSIQMERASQAKPLPAPLQKQLTETSELADATDRFASTFKPEFGGKTITGDIGNTMGRVFGDDTGQSQWWQDYELHQSQVRNKLFGSALTATEMAAWNKSAINPRMDSKQIQQNLTRRQELEQKAVGRLMRGAAVTYNPAQIEAFTGRKIPTEGEAPKAAPTAPASGEWSVKVKEPK